MGSYHILELTKHLVRAFNVQDTPVKLAIVVKVIGRTGSRGQVRPKKVHKHLEDSTSKIYYRVAIRKEGLLNASSKLTSSHETIIKEAPYKYWPDAGYTGSSQVLGCRASNHEKR